MRQRLSYLGVAILILGIVAALASAGRSATTSRPPARLTAANRERAIRDAARLLDDVMAPSGAVLVSRHSAVGVQHQVPMLTPAFASALSAARWIVPGQPGRVLAYVEANLPPGSKVFSTGSGGLAPGFHSVIRSWPVINRVLDTRWLEIAVSARSRTRTELSAEAQSQWVVARPAHERVEARVTAVEVAEGTAGHPPLLTRTVTARPSVKALVTLFNSLEVVQPVEVNCPAETAGQTVTVTFRGAANRPALAVATVAATADYSFPVSLPGWSCTPIGFTVAGRRSDALIGNVITPLDRLLHVRLEAH